MERDVNSSIFLQDIISLSKTFNEISKTIFDWRFKMAKGKDKGKAQEKKKPQKSIKEKRKQKKDKDSKTS